MDLSRTVTEINGHFSRKSKLFSNLRVTSVYFAPPPPPAEGVPLGIGYRRWRSKQYVATRPNKTFDDIFSRLDISTNVTGGQTPGDSKDHAYA